MRLLALARLSRFRHRAEDLHRLQPRDDLIDAGRVLAHHRFDLVLCEAALAQVVAQPLQHEAVQIDRDAVVQRRRSRS